MNSCSISNDWTFRGIEATVLENRELRVVVLHGKGTDISELVYKPLNLNVLFRNPWGPRSPHRFPNVSPHPSTFRDYTGGGWSDILPNAGEPCEFRGARFGLHDETPLLAWSSQIEEESSERVSARFLVRLNKYPLAVDKLVSLDSGNRLTITETVENDSQERLPLSWLVHPAFSPAFADGSSSLELSATSISRMDDPGGRSWPFPLFLDSDGVERDVRSIPQQGTTLDSTLVLSGMDEGRYSIMNSELGLRFTLTWDLEVFPYLWYYRSLSAPGYPYYGRSRFIALEPCTSKASGLVAQAGSDDALFLEGGESVTTSMVATLGSDSKT
jgi:galactose mutarotase-like enzyme